MERGFDIVTIFSCPQGGDCKEVKKYSDYHLQTEAVDENNKVYYFWHEVKCGSLTVNSEELRIRITSDGPLSQDSPDQLRADGATLKYKGFSAVYWSSKSTANEELLGCANLNATLQGTSGIVYAVYIQQLAPDGISNLGFDDLAPYGTPSFRQEFLRRDCMSAQEKACSILSRGESRWWVISPPKDHQDSRIVVAFRDIILDDNLDVLKVFSRKNNVMTEEARITGLNPFRCHYAMKCTQCSTPCRKFSGASGSISEWAGEEGTERDCTWVISTTDHATVHVLIGK